MNHQKEVSQIVLRIFSMMFNEIVNPTQDSQGSLDDNLLSQVDISGDWNGTLSVQLSKDLLKHLTHKMIQKDKADLQDEEMIDVAKELVNLIAGQYKRLIGDHNQLSIPNVTNDLTQLSDTVESQHFVCDGSYFTVHVFQK